MDQQHYLALQNGSDIRGVALENEEAPINLTAVEARAIARGFVAYLKEETGHQVDQLKVSVGMDPRESGEALCRGLFQGLEEEGVQILYAGLASTPAMFMSTVFSDYYCHGAIMITASHLPAHRNGFKFFDSQGGLDKTAIKKILTTAAQLHEPLNRNGESMAHPSHWPVDLMEDYATHLRELIVSALPFRDPLSHLHIVVDAGNGSGGFFATNVLVPLGANIKGSQFLKPDGQFPNHPANPENPEALRSLAQAVIEEKADLGLIFDTDVDRSAAIDDRGREIARNAIVALASVLVEEQHPGSTVVTDSLTSNQLTDFLEKELDLHHFRYRRGYRNVINKAKEIEDAYLAIETSGHAAFRDNYFLDDGAYLATLIVIKTAMLKKQDITLASLLENLQQPLEEEELRLPLTGNDPQKRGEQILNELSQWVKTQDSMTPAQPNHEGVRVNTKQGWFLLRQSLHDPLLALNLSSDVQGGIQTMKDTLDPFLSRYPDLKWGK